MQELLEKSGFIAAECYGDFRLNKEEGVDFFQHICKK